MWKFRETQWTYIVHVHEFQHMVMFKILVKSLKSPFWIFQAFEIFTKETFSKNSEKILACQIWHDGWSWEVSCLGEQYNIIKSPQNHFCPFWSLSNFTLPNMSKCSQTWCTCSNGVIMHLDQMAQVGEKDIIIKCAKTLLVQNQIWTTLHCQLSPFDLNFCGHAQIHKRWHYTKWWIKENKIAW